MLDDLYTCLAEEVKQQILNTKPCLVHGSALPNPGLAGFGGLVTDSTGAFLKGFYGSVGYSNILHAGIQALYHGLSLCWDWGFRKIVCFLDSTYAIDLIQNGNPKLHKFGNVIALIRNLIAREWEIHIQHTLREGHHCTDFLAKMGASGNSGLVTVESPPVGMGNLLLTDAMGITFLRS